MNALRMGVCCALIGWMAADAHAQLGTYGAPDSISWNQGTQASYMTTGDSPKPTRVDNSSLVPLLSDPAPSPVIARPIRPAAMVASCPKAGTVTASSLATAETVTASKLATAETTATITVLAVSDAVAARPGTPRPTSSTWAATSPTSSIRRTSGVRRSTRDVSTNSTGPRAARRPSAIASVVPAIGRLSHLLGPGESDTDGAPNNPHPNGYGTPMTMGLTNFAHGRRHRRRPVGLRLLQRLPDNHIWRSWQVQNVEANLVKTVCGNPCCPASIDFLVGFRWFRFQDDLVFGSQRTADNTSFANDWAYLNDHVTNDLIGLQAGFNANYRFCNCWKAFIRPEFGIFNNHTTLDYNLYAVSSLTGQQSRVIRRRMPTRTIPCIPRPTTSPS